MAVAAIAASSASANRLFASYTYPQTVTGTQQGQQFLTTSYGKVECNTGLSGSISEEWYTMNLSLTGTCSAFGSPYKISTNGCEVELDPSWGSLDIGPSGCGPIDVQLSGCHISIPAQNGLQATYETVTIGLEKKVLVTVNDSHLTYTPTTQACGKGGTSHSGTIEASWLLSAPGGVFLQPAYASGKFEAEKYPTSLVGSQEESSPHSFGTEAGPVKCATASFSGSLTEASNTMSLSPIYSGCEAFGFLEASIEMNGCTYVYSVGAGYPMAISCPAGKSILIKGGTCKVSISAQTGVKGNNYALLRPTSTGRAAIEIQHKLSGLSYTVTQDGFLCPFAGTGTRTTGAYSGNTLVEGRNGEGLPANIGIDT
jgi:hypothetical protein